MFIYSLSSIAFAHTPLDPLFASPFLYLSSFSSLTFQVDSIGSVYRTFAGEILAGDSSTVTEIKEQKYVLYNNINVYHTHHTSNVSFPSMSWACVLLPSIILFPFISALSYLDLRVVLHSVLTLPVSTGIPVSILNMLVSLISSAMMLNCLRHYHLLNPLPPHLSLSLIPLLVLGPLLSQQVSYFYYFYY